MTNRTLDFDNLDFDPNALREKYREERDKRMNKKGETQYLETRGDYSKYYQNDPYVDQEYTRDPITESPDIVVMGGGFAGLIAAVKLKQRGIENFKIIEYGGDFGGTWYWNRYPGAQCDIESYCYLPLLEETGYMPTQKYATATEIYEHCQRIAKKFGLYDHAIFHTRIEALNWNGDKKRWDITTDRDDNIDAQFVLSGPGAMNVLKLPGIPGILDFEGKTFHTSRWDYDYTGGDQTGGLTKLGNKKVAVIGTGATAIQCVPYLGEYAEHLYVFQRTPSSVDIRGNAPTDEAWFKSLKPGWQKARQENFNDVLSGMPYQEDLVNDGWTNLFNNMQNAFKNAETQLSMEEIGRLTELIDFDNMNRIRDRVNEFVKDEKTADKLKPWYRQFCKRPCFSDTYLATFDRPNVTLVDVSETQGVEKITKDSIISGGTEYKVDCIVFATGFQISTPYRQRYRFEINGTDGQSLYDYWETSRRTFQGHSVQGFPNWFFIGVSQNGVSFNYSSMIDEQAEHIAYIINEAQKKGAQTVEASATAEENWQKTLAETAFDNSAFYESCTPGYFNNEGQFKTVKQSFLEDNYAPGSNAFNALLKAWRDDGTCAGMEFN